MFRQPREVHGGAKRAKHRAKRSPQCTDPERSVGARPKNPTNLIYPISTPQQNQQLLLLNDIAHC
jgi:hypothetical protein